MIKLLFFLSFLLSPLPFLWGDNNIFYKSNAWAERIAITEDKDQVWLLEEKKEGEKENLTLFYQGSLFYTLTREKKGDSFEEIIIYPNRKEIKRTYQNGYKQEDIIQLPLGKEFKTSFSYKENSLEGYQRDAFKKIEKNPWDKISLLDQKEKILFFQKEKVLSLFPKRLKSWEWYPLSNEITVSSLKGESLSYESNILSKNGQREQTIQEGSINLKKNYSPFGLLESKEIKENKDLILSQKWKWTPSLLLLSYEEKKKEDTKKTIFEYENNQKIKEKTFLDNKLRQIISFEESGKKIENFNKKGESISVFFIPKE